MRIYSYLYAVMISGEWSPHDLNDWITDVMTVNEKYPDELYDLLYVNDREKILVKLHDLYWIKEKNGYDRFCVPEVVLGYYCRRYFSGKTSLGECVKLCGMYSDYLSLDMDYECFYYLLDEDEKSAEKQLKEKCGDFIKEAERQFDILENARRVPFCPDEF